MILKIFIKLQFLFLFIIFFSCKEGPNGEGNLKQVSSENNNNKISQHFIIKAEIYAAKGWLTKVHLSKLIFQKDFNLDTTQYSWNCENCGVSYLKNKFIIIPNSSYINKKIKIVGKTLKETRVIIEAEIFQETLPTQDINFCENYLKQWIDTYYSCSKISWEGKTSFVPILPSLNNISFEGVVLKKVKASNSNFENITFTDSLISNSSFNN